MKISLSFAVLLVLLAGCYGQDATTTTAAPTEATTEVTTETTTDVTTETTVATTETTTTSTPVPETTTETTTTTDQPTPTTEPTKTTTPATTTTSTTTTTTTTTTPPPSTSPEPISTVYPPPEPTEGTWNLTDGNITCVKLDLKARFVIPVADGKEYINLSPNATISGTCAGPNNTEEVLLTDAEYILALLFEKDSSSAFVSNITLQYTLPGARGRAYSGTRNFNAKIGNSYLCSSSEHVGMTNNVTMEIMKVQLQAFGDKQNLDFGTVEECEADNKVSDIVPIAVGIALLALVVVVLIAYFVGRRRSRQMGYQSV